MPTNNVDSSRDKDMLLAIPIEMSLLDLSNQMKQWSTYDEKHE